jgi:hypothetical protein
MAGILPDDVSAGGVVIRDAEGDPTNPANVQNAYSPLPSFLTSCLLTALPSDCTARIEPRQMNALVSELIRFAECLDPDGPWNCDSTDNLCNAFTTWVSEKGTSHGDGITIIGSGTSADPFAVGTIDCGSW